MIFDRTLLAQVLVVVLRPAAFVWSVSVLSSAGWAGGYLVVLGFVPVFATLDMVFQSVARHGHLNGTKSMEVGLWAVACPVATALLLAVAVGHGVADHSSAALAVGLVSVFVVAACFNLFESRISSARALLDQSVFELAGFGVCAVLALAGHPLVAAVVVNASFPLARLSTVLKHRKSTPNPRPSSVDAGSRSTYVGSAMAAQFLASIAASAPAVVVSLALMGRDRLAFALICFKLLFSVSSLFSVVVNLFGSRIFYGHIQLDLTSRDGILRVVERRFLIVLGVMGAAASVVLLSGDPVLQAAAVGTCLCMAFAYLNTMSSLALARGRPMVSAASQAVVFIGSTAFVFVLGGSHLVGAVMLLASFLAFSSLVDKERIAPFLKTTGVSS